MYRVSLMCVCGLHYDYAECAVPSVSHRDRGYYRLRALLLLLMLLLFSSLSLLLLLLMLLLLTLVVDILC